MLNFHHNSARCKRSWTTLQNIVLVAWVGAHRDMLKAPQLTSISAPWFVMNTSCTSRPVRVQGTTCMDESHLLRGGFHLHVIAKTRSSLIHIRIYLPSTALDDSVSHKRDTHQANDSLLYKAGYKCDSFCWFLQCLHIRTDACPRLL